MKRIRDLFPSTDNGRAIAGGLVLLAIGLFCAWPPAALIVPGAFLIALGVFTPPTERDR